MNGSWYLKKADGEIYGPVPLTDVACWAMDGRVDPQDTLSPDQEAWLPAVEMPELEMDCLVQLDGGEVYGPIHRLLLCDLILEGDLLPDQPVRDLRTQEEVPAALMAIRTLLKRSFSETPENEAAPAVDESTWLAAQQAQQELAGERDRLDAELQAARAERDALAQQIAEKGDAEAVIPMLHAEIEALKGELAGERDRLDAELQAARAERDALAQQIAEKGDAEEQDDGDAQAVIPMLHAEIEALKGELARAKEAMVEAVEVARTEVATVKDAELAELQAAHAALSAWPMKYEALSKELDAARHRMADMEAQQASPDRQAELDAAVAERTADLKEQLAREHQAHIRRERQLKSRLEQFEGDLKTQMEQLVAAKELAMKSAAVAADKADEEGENKVVKSALQGMRSKAIVPGSGVHSPRSQAQRRALINQAKPMTARVPPKKRR
jgi:hypothetical protein